MAAQTALMFQADPRFVGINNSELQEYPLLLEVPQSMANGDTCTVVLAAPGDVAEPPHGIDVYTHSGGDITSNASATFNINNGATILFQLTNTAGIGYKSTDLTTGSSEFPTSMLKYPLLWSTTLAGLTNGAATAAQIAASINADTAVPPAASFPVPGVTPTTGIGTFVYAVAGLTANAVTLFPRHPRVAFSVIGGTALPTITWAGTADWSQRTYVADQPVGAATGWGVSYAAGTRTLTLTNNTGGAKSRVAAFIRR